MGRTILNSNHNNIIWRAQAWARCVGPSPCAHSRNAARNSSVPNVSTDDWDYQSNVEFNNQW